MLTESDPINTEPCTIQYVTEKPEIKNSQDEKTQKTTKANRNNPYYEQPPQNYRGQNPYYEQQRVAGQPIYVQPQPLNVRNAPAYTSGSRRHPRGLAEIYEIGSNENFLAFEDQNIRHAFVIKVYILLCLQLLFTFGFILTCCLVDEIKIFMFEYYYLAYVGMVGMMVTFCTLACCQNVRRTVPINYIIFALCTFFFAYEFAFISIFYSTYTIAMAIGLTLISCICITIFAVQTSWDVTGYGLYLCVAVVILFVFGTIITIISIFKYMPILHVVYAGLIGLLFSFYLIYDTQQIVGGRRIQLSAEEYIMGALQLYMDIMYIFYCFLQIIGAVNK